MSSYGDLVSWSQWPSTATVRIAVTVERVMELRRYKCVIILCDQVWLDPDLDARNGILMTNEEDMLRLDSKLMMAQLNVRVLLEVLSI